MDPRLSKQSICNKHGIRIYPVNVYGNYFLEVEYNRTGEFDPRYIRKDKDGKPMVYRGKEKYDPRKKLWAAKVHELYETLFKTKVEPKIKRDEQKLKKSA